MSGLGWQPPRPGPNGKTYRPVEYNRDGEQVGRIDPAKAKKREEKRKTDMAKYFGKSAEAREKLRRSAAGIKEEVVAPAPKDELDLVVMNLLADPAVIDGKGAANLRVLTDDQRRARNRARMD